MRQARQATGGGDKSYTSELLRFWNSEIWRRLFYLLLHDLDECLEIGLDVGQVIECL